MKNYIFTLLFVALLAIEYSAAATCPQGMISSTITLDYTVCKGEQSAAIVYPNITVTITTGLNDRPVLWDMTNGYICEVILRRHGDACFDAAPGYVAEQIANYARAHTEDTSVRYNGQDGYCYTGQHFLQIDGADDYLQNTIYNLYNGQSSYCQMNEATPRFIFTFLWIGLAAILIALVYIFAVILACPSCAAFAVCSGICLKKQNESNV